MVCHVFSCSKWGGSSSLDDLEYWRDLEQQQHKRYVHKIVIGAYKKKKRIIVNLVIVKNPPSRQAMVDLTEDSLGKKMFDK